jgi:hypothetical protein
VPTDGAINEVPTDDAPGESSTTDEPDDEIHLVDGKLKLKHGQGVAFEDIPIGVVYTITGTPLPNYAISSENHTGTITERGLNATFKNIYHGSLPEGDTKLRITKRVSGEVSETEKDRAYQFTLRLVTAFTTDAGIKNASGEAIKVGEPPNEVNATTVAFTLKDGEHIEYYIPNGEVYEVTEENLSGDGYAQSITNGYGTGAGADIDIVQTNTYVGRIMRVVTGEKTWDMSADESAALPGSVTIYLMGNGAEFDRATIAADGAGRWRYRFTAPKYMENTMNPIDYTVEEHPIPNYEMRVNGFDIQNTYIKPDEPDDQYPQVPEEPTPDPGPGADDGSKPDAGTSPRTRDDFDLHLRLALLALTGLLLVRLSIARAVMRRI